MTESSSEPPWELNRTDRVTPAPRNDTPRTGWAMELKEAMARNKEEPCSTNRLRIAKSACVLRQWGLCKKAAEAGLDKGGASDDETTQLKEYLQTANEELAASSYSYVYRSASELNSAIAEVSRRNLTVNKAFGNTNMNMLHEAASMADVPWLEKAIATGAALDCPVNPLDPHPRMGPHAPTPKDCTALIFATAIPAVMKKMKIPLNMNGQALDARNFVRCAIVLVMLGADFNRRLEMPADPSRPDGIWDQFRIIGLHGLTVKEIAEMLGDDELLEAIQLMEDAPFENAWCRCGSRLPWRQCHSSPGMPGQHEPYFEETDAASGQTTLYWRLSPLAPCMCGQSDKIHFECCWLTSGRPFYQKDTGVMVEKQAHYKPQSFNQGRFASLKKRPFQVGYPGTPDEFRADRMRPIQEVGMNAMRLFIGPGSSILGWDPEVYVGVVERLENWFYWVDTQWMVEEEELLARVKEWNDALDVYCNDLGLQGAERNLVVTRHTASPLAPCGNATCDNIETNVKEFMLCSRCKIIAYCSQACQKAHWKAGHKNDCGE